MTAPLNGIRILDLSRLLPGPFCTQYLADLGADVIKIEDTKAEDYTRSLSPEMFALVNRNKRGIQIPLRTPEGVAQLKALARDADVVVEQFRPGVMAAWGMGYDDLKAENPKLVYCAITGYGQDGPYRDYAGHDMNYRGYAGELEQTGRAGGQPATGNFQVADIAGGSLTACVGILAAVIRAKETGQGGFVDISMTDGTFALQIAALSRLRATGETAARGQDMLTGGLPNYQVYECADGKHLAVGSLEPKFWMGLCMALDRPDIAKKPIGIGSETHQEVTELFQTRTRDEWVALLEPADCCVGPVLTLAESLQNEHLQSRGMIVEVDGKPQYANPIKISDYQFEVSRSAPTPGQHNAELLPE